MKIFRLLCALAALSASLPDGAHADTVQRSWNYLTTGNGHGFQVYDANQNKIVTFLDHPYRYLGPRPDPKADGYSRRNLAYDFYFGVRGAGSSGWLSAPSSAGSPEYLNQSNVIHAPTTLGAIQADSYFFAPFGYEGNAVIAVLKAPGATDGYVLFNFHMGTATTPDSPGADGEAVHASSGAVVETGPGGGAMVYVPLSSVDHQDCSGVFNKVSGDLSDNTTCSGTDVVPGFQKKLGSDGMMAVAVVYVDDPSQADQAVQSMKSWANGRAPQKLIDDALAEWESWRKPPPADILCSDDETKLWRQSEVVLRMGQIREPNTATRHNHGMILASLPPGEWHSGWVRDATYSTVALARMGHTDEAKMSLDFFLNAQPVSKYSSYVSNVPYKISVVRYFGSGEEQADYSGQQTPNIEIDGWGLFMWAARAYVEASGDTAWLGANYGTIISGVANALEANLETNGIAKADSSIWEVHDANKKHFAYTTITAARGFCDLAAMAKKNGQTDDQTHYQMLAQKIRTAFLGAFVDQQGALGGSLEGIAANKYYDGAVAEAFTMNILGDFTGGTATATLTMLNNLRVGSGGFKRNNDGLSSYDDNEWILVDLRIADSLRRAGRGMEAAGYVQQVIDKAAANFYLLPELYNAVASGQIGLYTGSIPMVGYGGGAYAMTMLDRAGAIEPNDCGDGMGVQLATFTCSGGTGPVPDGGSSGGGNGGNGGGPGGGNPAPDVPYLPACYCNFGGAAASGSALVLFLVPAALIGWRVRRRSAQDERDPEERD
jgi:GH15 family glucan-1,4-alpha-glucosidase